MPEEGLVPETSHVGILVLFLGALSSMGERRGTQAAVDADEMKSKS